MSFDYKQLAKDGLDFFVHFFYLKKYINVLVSISRFLFYFCIFFFAFLLLKNFLFAPGTWWMGPGRINREGEFHSHFGRGQHNSDTHGSVLFAVAMCDAFAFGPTPPLVAWVYFSSPRAFWSWWTTTDTQPHRVHRGAHGNTSWIHSSGPHFWFTCSFFYIIPFVSYITQRHIHTKEASTTVSVYTSQ